MLDYNLNILTHALSKYVSVTYFPELAAQQHYFAVKKNLLSTLVRINSECHTELLKQQKHVQTK